METFYLLAFVLIYHGEKITLNLTWRKTQLECYDFGHNFGTFFKNGDIKEIYIFSLKLEETEDKYDLTATAEYR